MWGEVHVAVPVCSWPHPLINGKRKDAECIMKFFQEKNEQWDVLKHYIHCFYQAANAQKARATYSGQGINFYHVFSIYIIHTFTNTFVCWLEIGLVCLFLCIWKQLFAISVLLPTCHQQVRHVGLCQKLYQLNMYNHIQLNMVNIIIERDRWYNSHGWEHVKTKAKLIQG